METIKKQVSPARVVLLGFLALIGLGTVLLMLPFAARCGRATPFLDALFTATSATCVTGLVVRDTFTYWAPFGQAVILLLIQIGGMGVVTMAVAAAILSGRRIGLRQRFMMQESIDAPQVGGIVRLTRFIVKTTLAVEGIGAALLALRFVPEYHLGKGLWFAVFHAVSAFCNAGFDLMGEQGPFSSLTGYAADPLVCLTVMVLIFVGGIGFLTWEDFSRNRFHLHAYRLQSKLILTVTAVLLVVPAVCFFAGEFSMPQWQGMPMGQRALAAAFQAVTPRTAGFNTVDYTRMSEPSILLTVFLMLTGGAPGSTAGGYKVTTLATLVMCVRSVYRRKADVRCFGKRLTAETPRSAAALFFLYFALFMLGAGLLGTLDGVPLTAALFESASAIGTVGLTMGVTPTLGAASRLVLIALMYFGRVGGLTLIYAAAGSRVTPPSQLPQEKITIG
ncbi:Ktr system potassium uptake protein KtrB [Oscillibacter valericigenes Sjm18-20]|nr:Ktr system potassium uptake protein KtrB [Oscillibacter valericigenes Sjm18-20]